MEVSVVHKTASLLLLTYAYKIITHAHMHAHAYVCGQTDRQTDRDTDAHKIQNVEVSCLISLRIHSTH